MEKDVRWKPISEILLEAMKNVAVKQKDATMREKYLEDLAVRAMEMQERGIDIGGFEVHKNSEG